MKSTNIFIKTIKVINSCTTKEQIKVAKNFYKLAKVHLLPYHMYFIENKLIEKH